MYIYYVSESFVIMKTNIYQIVNFLRLKELWEYMQQAKKMLEKYIPKLRAYIKLFSFYPSPRKPITYGIILLKN